MKDFTFTRRPDYESERVALFCGDCLEILPGLADGSVDMIFTDPPYGHNNNNGDLISRWEQALGRQTDEAERRPIANDGPEANDLFRASLAEWRRLLKPGCCCCCCCCGGGPDPQFARWSMWLDEVFQFKQMVVWDKGPMGMGWHYRRSYETVLVGEKPGAACRWMDTTNKIENIIRPGHHGIRKIIPDKSEHPTVKPVELGALFIRLHSAEGDTVFDPFMGSGTTGVAAVSLGRKFIGIEIDPKYFDIAVKRIKKAEQEAERDLFRAETEQGVLF
jgi:DNA modification methylase